MQLVDERPLVTGCENMDGLIGLIPDSGSHKQEK